MGDGRWGMAKANKSSEEGEAVVETMGLETVISEAVASVPVSEPERAGVPALPSGVRPLTLAEARALHAKHC